MTTSTMSSPISSNLAPTGRSLDRSLPGRGNLSQCLMIPRRKALTMAGMHALFRLGFLVTIPMIVAATYAKAEDLNDYPTSARADYVFGCMKANGETQELLPKCSCSVDVIASIIPYDRYVTTETI